LAENNREKEALMEGFEIARKDNQQVAILYLRGYLDAHTAPEFEKMLQKLIDEKKYQIIVNFKELNYISSAGLGVFMGYIEDIRNNTGDIKLSNMNPKIYRVFDLLGFPSLFEIFNEETEALAKFAN
jgi:anti-sigma B factor antagonist